MKIYININDIGNTIVTVIKNGEYKYVRYTDIKNYIFKEINKLNKVTIENGNIILENKYLSLYINNYLYNKNKELEFIIENAINLKIRNRKKYLKKQKIKRIKTFTGATIISLSLIMSNSLIKDTKEKKNIDILEYLEYTDIVENENINYINNNISEEINYEDKIIFDLDYESRIDTEKYNLTKEYYSEIISNISKEYGIDPQIMLAIATQESGIHSIDDSKPTIGLMQIEKNIWNNQKIKAYNFEKEIYETLNINIESLKDLEFNIRVACMYFQNCLVNSNYNIPVSIQMYNYGYGNMEKVFKSYYNDENIKFNDVINNIDNDWINYRNIVKEGDKEYLEHIMSYIENVNEIKCKKINNKEYFIFKINNNSKKSIKI